MSEYDQTLYEDDSVNRMRESLKLFDEIVNSMYFYDKPTIIFFNKYDIFKEKIKFSPLIKTFDDFEGGDDLQLATEYITKKFKNLRNENEKAMYTHLTTATDTECIRFVFDAIQSIVVNNILQFSGLKIL